jgi:hypothetical protein
VSDSVTAVRGTSVSPYDRSRQQVTASCHCDNTQAAFGAGKGPARPNANTTPQMKDAADAAAKASADQLKQGLMDHDAGGIAPHAADATSARGATDAAGAVGQAAKAASPNSLADLYVGGAPGAKDQWGDSSNVNKDAVFQRVYEGVKAGWDSGGIPQNVKDLFSGEKTDKYFEGLNLSSDPKQRAQQKAAIWELATASHETGNTYDPSKWPSYWEAGGDGSHAGQTQTPGMASDPKGMTYGMFSTYSKEPIDVSDPKRAVVADLQEFGAKYERLDGDLQKTLELIGQTDSTSVIPSIQKYGASYLEAFQES